MKYKINKKLLFNEVGFSVHNRYSSNENTDDIGRWARIIYFNGIQIAWINGYVKQDETPKIENGRTGICNSFHVSPFFPTSSSGIVGYENFESIDEAIKYVKDLFNDFIKTISK